MRGLLDSDDFQFRFDAGVTVPSSSLTVEQIDDITHSLMMHYLVFSCKAELDQLKQGLAELEVLKLLHNHPALFKPLFVACGKPKLTADSVAATFNVCWSPKGSNQRENEESVILGWMEYLQSIEGMLGMFVYLKNETIMHMHVHVIITCMHVNVCTHNVSVCVCVCVYS